MAQRGLFRRMVARLGCGFCLVSAGLCLAAGNPASDPKPAKDQQNKANQQEEFLKNYYKKWLEEDVYYIVQEDEKNVFLKLGTDEERDQFIEQFWKRRDPDPKTPYNEYKEDFYRRISYANEHFNAGIPGWKTERGMIYIKFGPPDHIEDYVYGAGYDRPTWEGGGKTKVFPTQFWEYRQIPGVGTDIELEFVDSQGGNLYTLQTDPNKKDLLLHASVSGKTISEQWGKSTQYDRVTNKHEGGDSMDPWNREREKDRQFNKYELLAAVSKAPEIQYKDLKSIVETRIKYDLFPFEARVDYVKISEQQVLVPVTLRVKNGDITFKDKKFGITRGILNVYGIVTTLSGSFVQEFEDDISRDVKTDKAAGIRENYSTYQKFLLLSSGIYKLGLVIKDVNSGRLGTIELKLTVPSYQEDQLSGSTIILARQIQKVIDPANDVGPFVLGDVKVIPDFVKQYKLDDPLWIYMQIYNMSIDQNRLEPDVNVEYIVEKDGSEFYRYQDLKGATYRFVSGDRLVITGRLPIRRFVPGDYLLRVRVLDNINGRVLERVEKFAIIS